MNNHFLKFRAAVLAIAILAAALLPYAAFAQTVTAQPNFVAPRAVLDLGNGPTEIVAINGSGALFTSFNTATASVTTTALTFAASQAANPPCVGCFITCPSPVNCTIPANTTIVSFNGTTGAVLSASSTVTAASVSYGQLCPISTQAAPVQPTQPMAFIQPGQPPASGLPMYTQGRVCAYGGAGPGLQFVNFAIGAH